MDCCNYGEYRGPAHGQYAAAGWEGYGYAPLPYTPYAHGYYAPHAHDPYSRYYRYDYPHHMHHNDHAMSMDYGMYASKEARVRRTLARRDQRAHTPAQHLPLPPANPSDCSMNGRGSTFCEPQMWPHYQMGGGGWNGGSAVSGGWASRSSCSREHMRYAPDCRPIKGPHMVAQNPACQQDGRSTPYPVYEDSHFNTDSGARQGATPEFSAGLTQPENIRAVRDRFYAEPQRSPVEKKRPPVVPLPAFQQAFGSTEIGKFAEAFSRTEVALDDIPGDNFLYESFPEWDGTPDPQWSTQPAAAVREIKCEDTY